jgi:hypothetical protein
MPRMKSGGVVAVLTAEVKGDVVAKYQRATAKWSHSTACG